MGKVKAGDAVWVKPGTTLPWKKGRVIRRRGKDVTVTGLWGQGVTGTLNSKFVKRRKQ